MPGSPTVPTFAPRRSNQVRRPSMAPRAPVRSADAGGCWARTPTREDAARNAPGRAACKIFLSRIKLSYHVWPGGPMTERLGISIAVLLFGIAAGPVLAAEASSNNDPDGTTPLDWAVRHDDLGSADALIKAGADVKAVNRYGVTPIYLAALNGKLLDAGVDPNSANAGGETALMTAARVGKIDAVKLLLDRGANVNARDAVHEQTALMWAVLENHADVVELLLARGADINAHTKVTITKGEYVPARPAAASGVGIIRQRALPTPNGGMTALLFAIRDGNAPMMRLLLDRGAKIEETSGNHTTPLIIALLNGQVAMATELLHRGADPNVTDDYHRGALFAAIDLRNFNHEKYGDLPTD